MDHVTLVVQGDDFGMCHAMNAGIVRAFTDGILTQTTVMAPCPWFWEAAELAQAHAIPSGVHCTLTSEWDHLRWGPITGASSLAGPDGTFSRAVEEATERAAVAEASEELRAQVERALDAGFDPIHLDCHMGVVVREAYEDACNAFGRRFLYPAVEGHFEFESIGFLSAQDDKLAWLLDRLEGLAPGTHLLISHPGVDSDELRSLTARDDPWTNHYRVSDLDVLTHRDVLAAVERLGIRLAHCGEL